ncbi:MAG TPA: HAMP domain-containing protein, partial [Polyangiaceae bacterium]|nr:HAMP domain-containing protein [Polyangiaceae bacterium]
MKSPFSGEPRLRTLPISPSSSSRSTRKRNGTSATAPETPRDVTSQILAALIAFKAGDFSVRLPCDWTGIDGKIADTLNDITGLTATLSQETARVSKEVGKRGRLKQRLSLPGAQGGWAQKVDSINTLIDDLVRPTTEVTRAISAVAKGDLTQPMTLDASSGADQLVLEHGLPDLILMNIA